MQHPLCPEELALPYAKFMELPMEPLPDEILAQIHAAPLPLEEVLPIGRISEFYQNGLRQKQFGYAILPDGTGYLAHYLYIPDLTLAQLGWWFDWQIHKPAGLPEDAGNLRYKIWCPPDHWEHCYVNGRDATDGVLMVESLDMGAGSAPVTSITRDIDPAAIGVSPALLDTLAQNHVVLQLTHEHSTDLVDRIFTAMMQSAPEGGIILMSRVWWGFQFDGHRITRDRDPRKQPCTAERLKNNLLHSSYEFNHLRTLLPLVYELETGTHLSL